MLDFINHEEYGFAEEGKRWAQESYDKLSKHIGKFVMLNEFPITQTTFDSIYPFPKNIGIIINRGTTATSWNNRMATDSWPDLRFIAPVSLNCLITIAVEDNAKILPTTKADSKLSPKNMPAIRKITKEMPTCKYNHMNKAFSMKRWETQPK